MSVIKLVAEYLKNICRKYFNWIYKSDSKPSMAFCVGVESTYMYLIDSLEINYVRVGGFIFSCIHNQLYNTR